MIFTVEEILWSLSNMPENLIVHHILLTSGPEISQIRNLRIEQIDNFPVMTFPVLSWNVLGVAMRMFPPQRWYHPIRWSDCIGQDRDSRHLGTLSTILQHFTPCFNKVVADSEL